MKESKSKAGNKRSVIIEAAVQVFSHKGYHNTKMEEIAVAAGIGKGTIYEYFDSKVQLFQEMLSSSLQMYYESFSSDEIERLSLEERIRLFMGTHFRFCLDNRELTRIVFWDADVFDEDLREWSVRLRREKEQRMKLLIEDGIRQGEIRSVDIKMLTSMLVGIMGSIWMPIVLDGWEVDPCELADQVTDVIMNGIANDQ